MRVPDAVQREASSRSGAPLIRDRTDWNGPGSAAHHSAALHAALRPGHESAATTAASCEEPTFTCGRIRSIVSGLLFTMKTATRTCEPSARGAEPAFVIAGHSVLKTRVRRYRVSRMRCSASVSEAVQR